MENTKNILRHEISNVHPIQKVNNFGGNVSPTIFPEYVRSAFSASALVKIQSSFHGGGDDQRFTYEIAKTDGVDYIINSTLVTTLPRLRVREGYEVRWRSNLFHRIIRNGELKILNNTISLLSPEWLDVWYQTRPKKRSYLRMIGNGFEWGREIPSSTISCPQPWCYLEQPLFVGGVLDLKHEYQFTLSVLDLVEIRDRDHEEVEPTIDLFESTEMTLTVPELVVRLAAITHDEHVYRMKSIRRPLNLDDVIHERFDVKHDMHHLVVPIDVKLPVKAIFWCLKNKDTRKEPLKEVTSVGIVYETTQKSRIPALPDAYYKLVEPWYRGVSSDVSCLYLCNLPLNSRTGDVGVYFDPSFDYRLNVTFSRNTEKSKHTLHIFYVVQRMISMDF